MSLARPASARRPHRARGRGTGTPPDLLGASRLHRAAARVRWDRVGRVALLVTLAIVICLYIQPALSILRTWRAERQQASVVRQLIHSNASLRRQIKSLNDPATIVADARTLGMVRTGEKPYVVLGLRK
jgi:cell division protein FtsB